MGWKIKVLAIALLTALVWTSGCQNVALGSTQVADFGGNSVGAQKVQDWFISKYGDPAKYSGPPRFLEPMVSNGITDNLPTNKVTKFSKDTPTVYAWAFYEGFRPGDTITASWTFENKQYASLSKQIKGHYGIVYGQFDMPKSGWALGKHTITFSGSGAQGSIAFDIIDGTTVKAPLPYQVAPPDVQNPISDNPPDVPGRKEINNSAIQCKEGFGDCDGNVTNGCESNLKILVRNCGKCGNVCSYPNADGRCVEGKCLFTCKPGYLDCDQDSSNGCETPYNDTKNCGRCGNVCPAGAHSEPRCFSENGTTCSFTCDPGYIDCDRNPSNGCEACGKCGNVCTGTQQCCQGVCSNTCKCENGICAPI